MKIEVGERSDLCTVSDDKKPFDQIVNKTSNITLTTKMPAVNFKLNPYVFLILALLVAAVLYFSFGSSSLRGSDPEISMKELIAVSIHLAERGGTRVKEIRESNRLQEKEKGKTKEGAKEMLTDGDMQSHRAIVYGFAKAFPGLRVFSEEHDTNRPFDFHVIPDVDRTNPNVDQILKKHDSKYRISEVSVWVDPLDATQEYTEDLTQYVTVMVCIAIKGRPKVGVIHFPFEKRTVWAWVGHGHSTNLKSPATDSKSKTKTNIIVSRSHAGDVEKVAKEAFKEKEEVEIIPAGGAGFKTVQVIEGKADAYVHKTLIKKWDICAGNAIIEEMGGRMTTLDGYDIDYSDIIEAKNEKGLLATVNNHNDFLDKFEPMAKSIMKNHKK